MSTLPVLMNDLLPFDNLLAWFVQVVVLVAVGAAAVLALRHPRARLLFWHGVLLLIVLLPFLEPRKPAPPPLAAPVKVATSSTLPAALPAVPAVRSPFEWRPEYLLWILVTGAVARFVWITVGLARLRHFRLDARSVASPIPFEGATVRWYVSDRVSGPVTFGWIKPTILLPSNFLDFDPDVREAIASHELLHVLRHDWLYVIAGEMLRCALWFHPAIWYVLGQVQLAREQVVDLEAVRLTNKRRSYLDALVAVAARNLQPDVAPAPLFLKKRQLAVRVAAVLKETSMSMPRVIASLAAASSAAVAAVALAVWIFPMQAHAQSETRVTAVAGPIDSPGVVVESGGPLMHRNGVFYPRGANVTGTVMLEATLNQKGEVTDARVLSGPNELRRTALESVLGWHYSTDSGAPPTVQVSIHFNVAPQEPKLSVIAPQAPVRAGFNAGTIRGVEFSGMTPGLERQLNQRIGVRPGDLLTPETMQRVTAAAHEIDEHIAIGFSRDTAATGDPVVTLRLSLGPNIVRQLDRGVENNGVPGGVPGGVAGGIVGGIPPPAPIAHVSLEDAKSVRVGGNVAAMNLIRKVVPAYPALAKQARIQGVVRFNATIAADGSVKELQLISGHPLMVPSATEAVKQWLYKPTLLNGAPVEVVTTIDVNFTLSEELQQLQ